jgi:hypothetical protein
MTNKVRLELFENFSFDSEKRFSTKIIKYALTPIYCILWLIQSLLMIVGIVLKYLLILFQVLYIFSNVSYRINYVDHVCFNYVINTMLFKKICQIIKFIVSSINKFILSFSNYLFYHSKFASSHKYDKIVDLPEKYSHLEPGSKITDLQSFDCVIFPSKLDIMKKYFTAFEKYGDDDYLWDYSFGIEDTCVIKHDD